LSFLNVVFVLGPFLGVVGTLFGLWIAGISFVISPLLMLISVAITTTTFSLFNFFISIIFCGLGIFACMGCYYATKALKHLTIRYLKFNVSIVKGEPVI
ncbi:MAG: DUF1700 domain-containing protein, partial [Lysinibacillus sp.]